MDLLYVWDDADKIGIGEFSQAVERFGIERILLSAGDPSLPMYKEFRDEFPYLEFLALASTTEFTYQHEYALQYVRRAQESGWDGIHFNVEPHQLPGYWDEGNQLKFLEQYIEMCRKCYEIAEVEFGLSIPYWYKTSKKGVFLSDGRAASEHAIDNSDHVAIMAYVPKTSLVWAVQDEVKYAEEKSREGNKKEVIVATQDFANLDEIREILEELGEIALALHHFRTLPTK